MASGVETGEGAFETRFFEDLRVGDSLTTPSRTITEEDVTAFAALTGDWHPQHVDAEWASTSMFGERVAHGLLVLSIGAGLMPLRPDRLLALRRIEDVALLRPTRMGDTVHASVEITGLRPVADAYGLVSLRLEVLNEEGKIVLRSAMQALWRTSHTPGPDADRL